MLMQTCALCSQGATPFHRQEFFCCPECRGIFRPGHLHLGPVEEKARYENHNNDIHDPAYRQFVSPITGSVLKDYTPAHTGLDFGAGTGSAISEVLSEKGYQISQYDPFFHDHPELLERKYDYIVCCEVIEHFHDPHKEFGLLKRLLLPGGALYCMTHIYSPDILFENWYYKNDPTHVFIYQKETIEWIGSKFGFSSVKIENRLIKFTT